MDKIEWCLKKERGMALIEPNPNLANAYLIKAEEALISMRINTVKDWKISTAYYAMYFSLYSILMRIGIKCEIHSCTIEFAKQFLKDYFSQKELGFFEYALEARVNAQYYVNRQVPDERCQNMIRNAPEILAKCKSIIQRLDEEKIHEIRVKLETKNKIMSKRR